MLFRSGGRRRKEAAERRRSGDPCCTCGHMMRCERPEESHRDRRGNSRRARAYRGGGVCGGRGGGGRGGHGGSGGAPPHLVRPEGGRRRTMRTRGRARRRWDPTEQWAARLQVAGPRRTRAYLCALVGSGACGAIPSDLRIESGPASRPPRRPQLETARWARLLPLVPRRSWGPPPCWAVASGSRATQPPTTHRRALGAAAETRDKHLVHV